MKALSEFLSSGSMWALLGLVGSIIFYGRFYVQWLASEREKKSVIPVSFWYMSSIGSLLVFAYSVHRRSPGAAFGQCFNILVYSRNLIHIWRERGKLTTALNVGVHLAAGVIVIVATVFMAWTWLHEYRVNQAVDPAQAARNWFWLGVWGVGQACFFARFSVQWLVTELRKKSVVPGVFWYLSVVASVLQTASFVQRHDWILAAGMCATIPIYLRNIWFIHRTGDAPEGAS